MYVIDSAGFPGRSIYVDRSDFYGLSPEVEQKGRKNIISWPRLQLCDNAAPPDIWCFWGPDNDGLIIYYIVLVR